LLVVDPPEGDLAGLDDAPMRALAAVVGQALEERGRVAVLGVGLEADGVAVELCIPPLALRQVHHDRGGHLVGAGHWYLLMFELVSIKRRDLSGHTVTPHNSVQYAAHKLT